MSARVAAVILAAGKGTRLKSELPKVLHEICARPMLAYVFDACRAAGVNDCIAIVGHGKDLVIDAFAGESAKQSFAVRDGGSTKQSFAVRDGGDQGEVSWVEQNPQLGTGHAVMVCREQIKNYDHVLVLCGDGPLIRAEVIRELLDKHIRENLVATLATAVIDDPTGYGRIWRDPQGKLLGIVEHGDCTPAQRAVNEVNPSYYCFRVADLLGALDQLKPNNVKGEYYITDCLGLFIAAGKPCAAITSVQPEDIYSINSRQHLAQVNDVMRRRILDRHMTAGVTIVDPVTTWIDDRVTIGNDTTVYPCTYISGPATIGRNCRIGPLVHVPRGTHLADGATLGGATLGGAAGGGR